MAEFALKLDPAINSNKTVFTNMDRLVAAHAAEVRARQDHSKTAVE